MILKNEIKKKIENHTGEIISSLTPVGGGCISDSQIVKCKSGTSFFLKLNNHSTDMFLKEANGLNELKKANAIRVPEVIIVHQNFLLLEHIISGIRSKYFFEDFGRNFSKLHKYVTDNFGFHENNYIGSTPQINLPIKSDWKTFYWDSRILFQIDLCRKTGFADNSLLKGISQIEDMLDEILKGSENISSLLHGDLWSGNFITDETGNACLIDPAVYYGNREADLAMTKLFGGFSAEFYKSYNDNFPLPDGYEYRENFYKLYHLLNHLNIFGRGYYSQVISAIKFYL